MGIVTIIMALGVWIFSAVFLWLKAGWIYGTVEIVLIAAGLLTAGTLYCTHCPLHNKGCVHGFIGIPGRLCKDRTSQHYSVTEILFTALPLLAIVAFPQYWLIGSPPAFLAYWAVLLIAVVLILGTVCPKCGNLQCGVKKIVGRR